MNTSTIVALLVLFCGGCAADEEESIRLVTFNLEDVRTVDLERRDQPRLRAAARVIQALQPDVLLINEMAYDVEGVPGFDAAVGPGQNAQRFADHFLSVKQTDEFEPLFYRTFMAPSNTGVASGFDLDRSGHAETEFPDPGSSAPDGSPPSQSAAARAYGNDSWGFGTFPGQYAMALFVRTDFDILSEEIHTFQHFLWKDLPDTHRPVNPSDGSFWYSDEIWDAFPLSSKSHWDVPIRTLDGRVIHILASHPTPPAFDGEEGRNKHRNRAEIQFWNVYLSEPDRIYDDSGRPVGLAPDQSFVIMGDLNADPDEGSSVDDPIGNLLLNHPRINGTVTPVADSAGIAAFPNLDPDDTSEFGMRVDYVLPSRDLRVVDTGIFRWTPDFAGPVGDHFPVFLDIRFTRL